MLRFGPARDARVRRLSSGAAVIVAGRLVTGSIFAFYVTEIASYTSVFGALATVIVLMSFLYLLSIVFLAGAQIDAAARRPRPDEAA